MGTERLPWPGANTAYPPTTLCKRWFQNRIRVFPKAGHSNPDAHRPPNPNRDVDPRGIAYAIRCAHTYQLDRAYRGRHSSPNAHCHPKSDRDVESKRR